MGSQTLSSLAMIKVRVYLEHFPDMIWRILDVQTNISTLFSECLAHENHPFSEV